MNDTLMNIDCLICSELLKVTSETVATKCGHVFHRSCIENWLKGSQRTCPTCRRENTTPFNLIKLYFEFDDNKANLNLEEILKNNDELTKKHKEEEQKALVLGEKCLALEATQKTAQEKVTGLERQKQLDDMAIAGLKSIKDDSTKEIIRLNEVVRILKLDLLAERQLRRLHQSTLHGFDPLNLNYNIENIKTDQAKTAQTQAEKTTSTSPGEAAGSSKTILPFWKLNCEAKTPIPSAERDPSRGKSPTASYYVPIKIQKAVRETIKPVMKSSGKLDRHRVVNFPLRDVTQTGYQFNSLKASTSTAQPEPSTASTHSAVSTQSAIPTQPVSPYVARFSFGVPPTPVQASTSTPTSNMFNFQAPLPSTQSSAPTVSYPQCIAFPTSSTSGSPQPSISTATVIANNNNQKRMFGERPKFAKVVSGTTLSNGKTFGFSLNLNAPTFQPTTSSTTSPAPTSPAYFNFSTMPRRSVPSDFDETSAAQDVEQPALLNGNGPKMSDR